jgi:hypothetical protein
LQPRSWRHGPDCYLVILGSQTGEVSTVGCKQKSRDKFSWSETAKRMGPTGVPADICRKAGISQATYFNWKKNDGLLPTEMRRQTA